MISSSDTIFDFGVKFEIFGFCQFGRFFPKNVNLKNGIFEICFRQSAKCKMTAQTRRSCFCQNLQFRMYFAIKTSVFQLRPLLRFLCLINSSYRRYVSSMYNRSNRSNRLNKLNLAEAQQLKTYLFAQII